MLTIPVALGVWGTSLYSDWLLLATIPAMLFFADFGIAVVVGNSAVAKLARGQSAEAISLVQSANALIYSIALTIILLGSLAGVVLNLPALLALKVIGGAEAAGVFSGLMIQVGGIVLITQSRALFRVANKNASGILGANISRFCSTAATIVAILQGGSPVVAAWTGGLGLLMGWLGMILVVSGSLSGRWLGFSWPSDEMKKLWIAAISSCAFPSGAALTLQGTALIVGRILGAEAVVVFVTHRTMARVVLQLQSLINNSTWTEYAHFAAHGAVQSMRQLMRKGMLAAIGIAIVGMIALLLAAPLLERYWLRNRLLIDLELAIPLLVASALCGFWNSILMALYGTNRHTWAAAFYSALSIVSLYGFSRVLRSGGLSAAAYWLVLTEILMLLVVHIESRRLIRSFR